jgi:hypothetical protein
LIRAKNVFAAPLIAFVLLLVLAAAAQANTIVVNVTGDPAGAGDCASPSSVECSLRQAINSASANDTIQLDSQTYTLTQGTNIVIAQNLTIQGNGVDATVIDGSGNSAPSGPQARILRINAGTVTIKDMSINNGIDGSDENFQSCSPCETINANGGGSLFNDGGTVAINDVAFNGELTSSNPLGGAISNGFGTLTMTDVSFTHEQAAAGGALFVRGGTVSGVGVTFEDNGSFDFDGGAVYLLGGTVSLTNSTIVGNGAASSIGGGIANGGANLTLLDDTFSGNVRGAIQTDQFAATSVGNTIIGAGFADGSDFACLRSGRWTDPFNNRAVVDAISEDLGNNFDQDGHCGFDGNGDIADADPRLASLADNGGPTRTQALLAGSQAIDSGNQAHCLANDQRDISRDGLCDIGAFQTHPTSAPGTPSTGDAGNITDSSADLHGTINLSGDAGGFHFIWGVTPNLDDLVNSTPIQGAGVVDSDTSELQTLSNLSPGTTYFYRIVADNSTGSATADSNGSFTTLADAPNVSQASVGNITDTTADLSFTINPNGDDTSYVIKYGDGDPGDDITTDPVPIGAQAGDQQLTATLSDLDPNSSYHFDVVATNNEGQNDFGDQSFDTAQQIEGTARLPVELDDSGQSFDGCPETASIDWGDGTAIDHASPDCLSPGDGEENPAQYSLTADHTYAEPGHYEIDITYPDIEQTAVYYAQVSENDGTPPSNNTLPEISGTPNPSNQLTCSQGSWTNSPSQFAVAWKRDGGAISGATSPSYTVQSADQGHTLTCTVIAHNDGGDSAPATSAGVAVPGAGPASTGGGGSGSTGGSGSGSKPAPNQPTTSTPTPTSAAFDGSVNPDGLATTAHFEYGLDSKYTNPGTSGPVYDQQTPSRPTAPARPTGRTRRSRRRRRLRPASRRSPSRSTSRRPRAWC